MILLDWQCEDFSFICKDTFLSDSWPLNLAERYSSSRRPFQKENLLMVYLNASDAWSFFASLQHLWITWFMAKSIKLKQYTITLDLEGSTVAAMLSHIHLVTDCDETWTQWLMGVGTTFDQKEIEVSGHLMVNITYYLKIFKIHLLPQSTFCSWKLVIMFLPAMHKFWDSRLFYVIRGQKVKIIDFV